MMWGPGQQLLRQPHRPSAWEAGEGWMAGRSKCFPSLCTVYKRARQMHMSQLGGARLGAGVLCSAQKVPNAASYVEKYQNLLSRWIQCLSPPPCSHHFPSGAQAHFHPRGVGCTSGPWASWGSIWTEHKAHADLPGAPQFQQLACGGQ